MIKNYYQTLEVNSEATPTEIKKAYFKLVRAYPPDRHPDQFMKIREAYEVLSNEQARLEYNKIIDLPEVVALYYQRGQQALAEKDPEYAIRCLEEVLRVYPRYKVIRCLLGDAYLANDNSGKAIRIFEKLVDAEPGNAGYVRRLAHSYYSRGWHRRALTQYLQARELDQDNLSVWLGLCECYTDMDDLEKAAATAREGLAVSKRNGWDNLPLYYLIVTISLVSEKYEDLETDLRELREKAFLEDKNKANIAWFFNLTAGKLAESGLFELAIDAAKTASALLPEDQEIASQTAQLIEHVTIDQDMCELIDDPSIDQDLVQLIAFELSRCSDRSCTDCSKEEFKCEMDIVANLDEIRPSLARLKKKYPQLYQVKAEFLDLVANRKKEQYLLDTYFKKLRQFKKELLEEGYFEDDEDDEDESPLSGLLIEPYSRSEPKVGRNEPCPCGSGKKYKKCCGR